MKDEQVIILHDLQTLDTVAKQLAQRIPSSAWVYLQGDLGTGKTTFSQRFIAAKGCPERVTSPTYALMQDYETPGGVVIHCDLYRLAEPEELYEIGLLEMADSRCAIVLVEWADKGQGVLPSPDFTLAFELISQRAQCSQCPEQQGVHRQLTLIEH